MLQVVNFILVQKHIPFSLKTASFWSRTKVYTPHHQIIYLGLFALMNLNVVHGTSSHPPSSPALRRNGAAVVFCASGVRQIVTALIRAVLWQILHHLWDVLLHEILTTCCVLLWCNRQRNRKITSDSYLPVIFALTLKKLVWPCE